MAIGIREHIGRRLAGRYWWVMLLLLPLLLILVRGANGFAYPSADAPFSDLTLTHFTNTAFLRDQLFSNKQLPLWAGTILSGYPFAANPLSGMWYPFGWPALFLPLPLAFNLLVGLHLSWGALGLYLLLRHNGLERGSALFGGLAFGLLPKLYAHYGAGHLTLLYAVPWTPWLLLASYQYRTGRRLCSTLVSGLVLALIFLADVRWAAYAGALWLAWTVWLAVQELGAAKNQHRNKFGWLIVRLAVPLLTALSLAAVLWLPMLEYTRLSTRSLMTPQEIFEISLAPAGLLGLLYPPLTGGAHETTLYPGALVLMLAGISLVSRMNKAAVRFWSLVALVALIFSLGNYLPFFDLLARLPLVNLLRVPPRALFVLGLALAVLAAFTIDNWNYQITAQVLRRSRLVIASLLGFTLLISAFVLLVAQPERPGPFIWGIVAFSASSGLLFSFLSGRPRWSYLLAGALLLLMVDSGVTGQAMLAYQPQAQVQEPDSDLGIFLADQTGHFRSYSPSFSLLQHNAYVYGLELTEGVDPLQLADYAAFMQPASGVPLQGYSVTLPPLQNGLNSNISYHPNPELLGLLNVRYVLADGQLPTVEGLQFLQDIGGTRVYENLAYRPRVWVEPELHLSDDQNNFHTAQIREYDPNLILLEAEGPGLLVLSEINYPGWQVYVDGQPAEVQTAHDILRAVELPSGPHQITWRFRPTSLYVGAVVSILSWLTLTVTWLVMRRSSPASSNTDR